MLDDLTTATTAHGLQLHLPREQNKEKSTTVAVQAMNIEIQPPEGKTKYLAHRLQKRRTRHQLRVGSIHEPQAGVDATKMSQRHRRHSDPHHSSTPQARGR